MITGASEGLGKSFALECASRNMNLVLVALPGAELYDLQHYIRRNFDVDVIAIEQDLALDNSAVIVFNKICSLGLRVNILINNAGVGNTKLFEEERVAMFETQIRLNVLATTLLTHLFMPMLKENAPSYIMNVGSLACFFAIPRKQVYGGTKSFIYFFSRSLAAELACSDVKVTVLCPGGINSNAMQTMFNKSGSWFSRRSLMNPEQVAGIAISGMLQGKTVLIPGKLNRLVWMLNGILPGYLKRRIINAQIGRLKAYQPPGVIKTLPIVG